MNQPDPTTTDESVELNDPKQVRKLQQYQERAYLRGYGPRVSATYLNEDFRAKAIARAERWSNSDGPTERKTPRHIREKLSLE